MSETKVPEIDEVSKAHCANLRSGDAGRWGFEIAEHVESLALENGRLKAELARRETADAHYGSDPFGEMAKVKSERDRAVEMLNDANRRLTALLDATEEKDVAGG